MMLEKLKTGGYVAVAFGTSAIVGIQSAAAASGEWMPDPADTAALAEAGPQTMSLVLKILVSLIGLLVAAFGIKFARKIFNAFFKALGLKINI